MAAETPRSPPSSSGRSRPIILLDLTAPVSDDRSYNDWVRFFALSPLSDDADSGWLDPAPVEA